MITKMLSEHGEGWTQNFNKIIEKCKKVPNRSLRAEEYNNWTEKYNRVIQANCTMQNKESENLRTGYFKVSG